MAQLPDVVYNALKELTFPAVFSTTSKDGVPNGCWVALVKYDSRDILLINDSVFSKTRENIFSGSKGSVSILTKDFKAYQIKGELVYHTEGALWDYMRANVDVVHARVAAVELKIEEVWEGAERLA
jgi:predicted pyridoxine 5'-phosphate oxidase superfamily flavin-nucleotide-binding protein